MPQNPAPGLRERKKTATRFALVEAAVRLAAEHGAENVTVEAISQAAGVSPRTFFNYFDCRDDAFVMADPEAGRRMQRAVLDAPARLSPLEAVRDALEAELADMERHHELWRLRARVLHRSPHLLASSLGTHMADERMLASAIALRMGGTPPGSGAEEALGDPGPDAPLGLYPRLLAGTAAIAVRVAIQYWSASGEPDTFRDIFRRVFAQLAAGLDAPAS